MESLLAGHLDAATGDLIQRLKTMPPASPNLVDAEKRATTLSNLAKTLELLSTSQHEAV